MSASSVPRTRSPVGRPRTSLLTMGRRATKLLDDAKRFLVGGVNSPVRAFRQVGQEPLVLVRGQGAWVTDAQGRQFLDFILGWGSLILGHAHPRVVRTVRRQVANSAMLGLTHPAEVHLAQAITEALPSIGKVRFTTSGTEACMTAIRLARAYTGRSKILTFEGCYHGHSDGVLVKRGFGLATLGLAKSGGVPEAIAQETIVIPYNDLEALDEAITRDGAQLACAILEPVAANMGVVAPQHEFLQHLREMTKQRDILLIFDEVVTGFRVAYGGAQTLFGITPDLTVLGKIIGGGFPIGAVGGPWHLMQRLAPEGEVYHAGTFAGHPVAMAAGLATLAELKRESPYGTLESLGGRLAQGLLTAASAAHIPIHVNQVGSMLTVFFSEGPVTHLASAQHANATRFATLANVLRKEGVLIAPSPFEAMFLSTAHTQEHIDRVIDVASGALAQVS